MNPNTVRTFFNRVQKVAGENNLSGTPWNVFKIDEICIQLNNKPDTIITQKGIDKFSWFNIGINNENITVTACCSAARQFVPKSNFQEGQQERGIPWCLTPGSDVHMNRKLSHIGTGLFFKLLTGHFLKHKAWGRVILLPNGHSAYCSSTLVLQTAAEINDTYIHLRSHCTVHTPYSLG